MFQVLTRQDSAENLSKFSYNARPTNGKMISKHDIKIAYQPSKQPQYILICRLISAKANDQTSIYRILAGIKFAH